ncbi:MAG: peptidylprolyl isomerase [Acidobacteriota bacterium]
MLSAFRKKQKGLKWILWLVILALAGGMLLLFVDVPTGYTGGLGGQEVAVVCGETIGVDEFRRQYGQLYQTYREVYKLDQQDPALLKQLGIGQQALNQLISEYAIWCEAKELGIQASTQEVRQQIMSFPVFQQDGNFIGQQRYRDILQANSLTPAQFEESVRRQIVRQKFQSVLTDGILATPEEVKQEYLNRNQEVKVRYVAIDPVEIATGDISEEQLKEYFDSHQDDYNLGEQRKIEYVVAAVDPTDVELTEEQVQAQLANAPQEEQMRASHILISTREGKSEEEAGEEAEQILEQVRAGADFALLAREHSDDPGSAAQGGDLGFFGRGQMVPEFEQMAFSLQPGGVSDLVKTPFGYHIIKRAESSTSDPRRAFAEFEARMARADEEAQTLAAEIAEELQGGASLQEVAQKRNLAVQETGYFSIGDQVPGLAVRNDYNQQIFALESGGSLAPYNTGAGRFVVSRLVDVKLAPTPAFEELRSQVAEDYKTSQAENLAREKAFAVAKNVEESGKSFEEAAQEQGLQITTTGFFKKGSTIDETLKFSPQLHDQAFVMEVGEVSSPIVVTGKTIVFQVLDKTELDQQQFDQEKEEIAEAVVQQKRSQFMQDYLQNVLEQHRNNESIRINQELVDAITG